ncbi:MAG: hypothetical protein ACYCSO_05510 [Cuniculiplasma sp.]
MSKMSDVYVRPSVVSGLSSVKMGYTYKNMMFGRIDHSSADASWKRNDWWKRWEELQFL